MRPIKSQNLGRTIWVADSQEERDQLIRDGIPESDIYGSEEIVGMKGISPEGLRLLQRVKDIFPGAVFESLDKLEPKAPAIESSTTDQMSLL